MEGGLGDEHAKALAASAEFGTEAIKAGEKVGSYLVRVIGGIPENLVGLAVGDWLEHMRRRNLARLEANTARILEQIDRSRLIEPSPSVLIPLLQAAVDESRGELQQIWANLLARLMTDRENKVRRAYFEVLNQMEPLDVTILEYCGWLFQSEHLAEIEERVREEATQEIRGRSDDRPILNAEEAKLRPVQSHETPPYRCIMNTDAFEAEIENVWRKRFYGVAEFREVSISLFRLHKLSCIIDNRFEAACPTEFGHGLLECTHSSSA
jgi:hypothetical protein